LFVPKLPALECPIGFKTLMKEQNANSMIRSWSFVSREQQELIEG